jgi:hypothetical protein
MELLIPESVVSGDFAANDELRKIISLDRRLRMNNPLLRTETQIAAVIDVPLARVSEWYNRKKPMPPIALAHLKQWLADGGKPGDYWIYRPYEKVGSLKSFRYVMDGQGFRKQFSYDEAAAILCANVGDVYRWYHGDLWVPQVAIDMLRKYRRDRMPPLPYSVYALITQRR